jgi:pyridoxal/pyridoxine/pyridoxamine kinase
MESCAAPGALRIVDPAMADNGRLYAGFAPDFPSKMARLCAGADFILPNLTEAAFLVGETPKLEGYTREEIEHLIAKLHGIGAKNVILTGVSFDPDLLGSAISDGGKVEYDFNPRLKKMSHGTGDVYASVFAGAVLRGKTALEAAALAADVVCEAIKATDDDHWYGVSFERGTYVDYADRRHVFISGTASINNKGQIINARDVVKQAQRVWDNVGALLSEADCTFFDVAMMIVYLRDTADYHVVRALYEERFPGKPYIIVHAPVCRPGWLVEMECMAVKRIQKEGVEPF